MGDVGLDDDLERAAGHALAHAAEGDVVSGVLATEPTPGCRVYVCSVDGVDGTRGWLAVDASGAVVASRAGVRAAVSIAALCEVAVDAAGGGDLDGLIAPEAGDLLWDLEATPDELGRINDLAYGFGPGEGMAAAFGHAPESLGQRRYRALVDGEVACVLATMDHAADTGVYFVATHPEHRGGRLASRLLGQALRDARERGQRTASLQASAMGAGVYRRLGFQDAFRLLMYERRDPAPARPRDGATSSSPDSSPNFSPDS